MIHVGDFPVTSRRHPSKHLGKMLKVCTVHSWFTESYSYWTLLAMRDNTTHLIQVNAPALTPASKPVLDLPSPEGWKAELT